MTATFKGGLTVKHATGGSPEYAAIEEVIGLSGFGATHALIDATSHDSTAREYIAGLADGNEITVECNRVHTASNVQDAVIADEGTTVNFQVLLTDGSTLKTYTFAAVVLSWNVVPSFDDKTTISFTLKISGSITES